MELLRLLTVVYAAVLVLALAASLLTIWIYLRRIGSALAETQVELEAVQEQTEPLEGHLQPLHEALGGCRTDATAAQAHLARADERLGALAERLGAGELVR